MNNQEWLDSLSNDEHATVMEMVADFEKLGMDRDAAIVYIRELMEGKL